MKNYVRDSRMQKLMIKLIVISAGYIRHPLCYFVLFISYVLQNQIFYSQCTTRLQVLLNLENVF